MRAAPALAIVLLAASPALAQAPARGRAGIAVGDITWAAREVARAEPPDKTAWQRVVEGAKLRTGDTLRTGENATARVDLPWMSVTLGGLTMLTIPATAVLSTVLEQGRAEFSGPGRDIVKIQVGEGEVRGGGRLVLRRTAGRTAASALEGAFRVRAAGRSVEIRAGQGTVVQDGRPPEPPVALPEPPTRLQPGKDVGYVRAGQPVELRWRSQASAHQVELLAMQGERVLLTREAGGPPLRLELPWLGTYRWRVASRDTRGLESVPSAEGLVCAVER